MSQPPYDGVHAHRVDIGLGDALQRLYEALRVCGTDAPLSGELVELALCRGRVTADAVYARVSSPHYEAAAMDGFAVRSGDTVTATVEAPVTLSIGLQCGRVDTGDPILPMFDAVVMIESVGQPEPNSIQLRAPATHRQHIRPIGEDIVASDMVFPVNHRLRSVDLGAVAAAGHHALLVRRRPRVAIIPTGSELVAPGAPLNPGAIVEYNSIVLAAMADEWGAETRRLPILEDDLTKICRALQDTLPWADIVVLNAGSSAGSEDFTAAAISRLGHVLVHGLAIKPGHPAIIGIVNGTPVLGIPGYPVSAVVAYELLAGPLIHRLQGLPPPEQDTLDAVVVRGMTSSPDLDDFVRVHMGLVDGRTVAHPMSRGSGVVTSLVEADGILHVPQLSVGYVAGDIARVRLLRPRAAIEQTILLAGSHDPSLKFMANWLSAHQAPPMVSVSGFASLGGLLALGRGDVHLAGCCILDEETGDYNVPFIRRLLTGVPIVVVTLVHRMRGLLVRRGDSLAIRDIADVARHDARWTGTSHAANTTHRYVEGLRAADVDPAHVGEYDRDELVHLGVAAAVVSGSADVGIGTLAVANAFDLDFVPLREERYDLVMTRDTYASPILQDVLRGLTSPDFQAAVVRLGGYRVDSMGAVVDVT